MVVNKTVFTDSLLNFNNCRSLKYIHVNTVRNILVPQRATSFLITYRTLSFTKMLCNGQLFKCWMGNKLRRCCTLTRNDCNFTFYEPDIIQKGPSFTRRAFTIFYFRSATFFDLNKSHHQAPFKIHKKKLPLLCMYVRGKTFFLVPQDGFLCRNTKHNRQ
jgi:hypothetical protein